MELRFRMRSILSRNIAVRLHRHRVVDGMVLELIAEHPLERGDVVETREGVYRLGPSTRAG
jgi:hypothetical protein